MPKYSKLPVALVQERNHGDTEANLAVIETRVAEAAQSGAGDFTLSLLDLHGGQINAHGLQLRVPCGNGDQIAARRTTQLEYTRALRWASRQAAKPNRWAMASRFSGADRGKGCDA